MGLSEIPANYMPQNAGGHVVVYESPKDKMSNKRKIHLLKKIKKRFGLVRRSPSSCPGQNNLPPLQFHTVHGDNIRISRDGTLARRFESFCRAITFSARPVRINERIFVKFSEISNNWNGGIRFGFTNNDPATLENALPKYACPDLTNRPGFWAKALHEQYCEKDNILYYYVNSSGDVIYGINNEEKGVILSGIDTRGMLWTIIDIYGNCTAIEFLDARIYMYQQQQQQLDNSIPPTAAYMPHTLPGPQTAPSNITSSLSLHNAHQQSRRSLPAVTGGVEQQLERHVMPSLQSLNLSLEQQCNNTDSLPPLRYNANGRLIPVPFHITKGRNVRLSHDRFIASRTENDFCQGYVFTARPIRLGERIIVQVLKTEHMYVGALALGLTSCNPATLQANDLPNDSDFLLDRPEYWVVSKDIAAAPQRCDEIAFFVAPNGEVSISKNNGPAVIVMHVDQTLQLWAFLDVYGSTQSVRMFRQQLPNMVSYPTPPTQNAVVPASAAASSSSINALNSASSRLLNHHLPVSESMSSLNSSACVSNNGKLQMAALQHSSSTSSSTLASALSSTHLHNSNVSAGGATTTVTSGSRMISMPSNGDILQIQQPNGGGTVLVVNLPPPANTSSSHDLSVSQSRLGGSTTTGILTGTCTNGNYVASGCSSGSGQQYIEPIVNGNNCSSSNNMNMNNNCNNNKWKDTVDHSTVTTPIATTNASCSTSNNGAPIAECTICYENQIDSVLYMCGHMCMCYDCAIEQWRGVGGGQCPLCRAVIRDVIRTYTT